MDGNDLPREMADRFTKAFGRFLKIEAAAGVLLLLGVVLSLAVTNSPWSANFIAFWETPFGISFGSMEISRSLRHWINDGLMALFFFVISLELKREIVLGELRDPQTAALPLAAAIGGMVIPVVIYVALVSGEPGMNGWGTVMATDTAFVVGCVALFGTSVPPPLRLFLLAVAIFDDVGAIMVVAIAYNHDLNWLALGLGIGAFGVVFGLSKIGIRNIAVYIFLGVLSWFALDASGIHATLAGVILGLLTPTQSWVNDARLRLALGRVLSYPGGEHWSGDTDDRRDLQQAGRAVTESLSPVERLEVMLHPWVGFVIVPLFALANAGVVFAVPNVGQSVASAIVVGLALGKPIGVLGASWIVLRFGVATRAKSLTWPYLIAGACLTGIGFTMSLFIAGLAFDQSILNTAKIGVLVGSTVSAGAGLLMLSWLTWSHRKS